MERESDGQNPTAPTAFWSKGESGSGGGKEAMSNYCRRIRSRNINKSSDGNYVDDDGDYDYYSCCSWCYVDASLVESSNGQKVGGLERGLVLGFK